MPVLVTCACGASHYYPDSAAGHDGQCPNCGRVNPILGVIPEGAPARPETTAAPVPALPLGYAAPPGAAPVYFEPPEPKVVPPGWRVGAVLLVFGIVLEGALMAIAADSRPARPPPYTHWSRGSAYGRPGAGAVAPDALVLGGRVAGVVIALTLAALLWFGFAAGKWILLVLVAIAAAALFSVGYLLHQNVHGSAGLAMALCAALMPIGWLLLLGEKWTRTTLVAGTALVILSQAAAGWATYSLMP